LTSTVIAIAGAKGSPGCSFLAVAIARCLAANDIRTLLLDGDAEGGGVASLLDADLAMPARAAEGRAGDERQVGAGEHLWFAEVGQVADGPANGIQLVDAARSRHQSVVVDLGHSTGALQRQLSAAADWLLWVVVPDRSGLERADTALESGVLGAAKAGLVFNRIGPRSLSRAEEVLSSRHQLGVMARINEDRRLSERLSQGLPIHRERSVRRTLRELVRSIDPGSWTAVSQWR
jgi:MinD-like ATPase involved in chromosome partitioning or flagellar assembly